MACTACAKKNKQRKIQQQVANAKKIPAREYINALKAKPK